MKTENKGKKMMKIRGSLSAGWMFFLFVLNSFSLGQTNALSPAPSALAGLRLVHAGATTNPVQFLLNGRNISGDGLAPGYAGGLGGFPAGKVTFTAKTGVEPVSPPLSVELSSGRNVAVVAYLEPIPEKDRQPGKPDKKLSLLAIPQESIPEGQSRFRLLLVGEPSCEIQCNDQKINLEGGKIQTAGGAPQSVTIRQGGKVIAEGSPVKPEGRVIIIYRNAAGESDAIQYAESVMGF